MAPPHVGPQSQIETAISLPRPDPAAIWLAQQEAQRGGGGQSRSSGVIIAVVALAALCVIGVAALLYFKFRAPSGEGPSPTGLPVASAMAAMAPATGPSGASNTGAAGTASTASNAAAPATSSNSGSAAAASTSSGGASGAGAAAPAKDVGFLTLDCDPRCDQVLAGGRYLVPPIVREPFPPGPLRVTAKLGPMTKVISVVIVAGQSSPTHIAMKK